MKRDNERRGAIKSHLHLENPKVRFSNPKSNTPLTHSFTKFAFVMPFEKGYTTLWWISGGVF